MDSIHTAVAVPPRLGMFLTQAAEMPDIEGALRKILTEYLQLKIAALKQTISSFETKWGSSFSAFTRQHNTGVLEESKYSYEVERDFWEWEKAVTLLQHYELIQGQWI